MWWSSEVEFARLLAEIERRKLLVLVGSLILRRVDVRTAPEGAIQEE